LPRKYKFSILLAIMAISNGVNGHTNGSEPTKNGKAPTKYTQSISSTLSDLFYDNITAKILHAAETGLKNNVSSIKDAESSLLTPDRTHHSHIQNTSLKQAQTQENMSFARNSSGHAVSSQALYTHSSSV
jgi:hypothetical protein